MKLNIEKAVDALAALSEDERKIALRWAQERSQGGAMPKRRKRRESVKKAQGKKGANGRRDAKEKETAPPPKKAPAPAAPVQSRRALGGIASRLRGAGSGENE